MGDVDDDDDQLRRSQRSQTSTEKGLSYALQTRHKDRLHCAKALSAFGITLGKLLTEDADPSTVKTAYAEWLVRYEHLLFVHDEFQKLLQEGDRQEDETGFRLRNDEFQSVKRQVEDWFESHSPPFKEHKSQESGSVTYNKSSRVSVTSKASSRTSATSKASSKASSALSVEKMKETQRKMELLARESALAERKELEVAKLDLKMREEHFKIKTELEVSDARAKVLESLERSQLRDEQDLIRDEVFSSIGHTGPSDYGFGDRPMGGTTHVLNPDVPAWTPSPQYPQPPGGTQSQRNYYDPFVDVKQEFKPTTTAFDEVNYDPASNRYSANQQRSVPQDDRGLLTVARELNKPKAEIQSFDGDPRSYNRFIRQFEARVSANTDSFDERLNYLLQFTTGEAYRIASGYSHLNAESGFKAALEEFKDRYGDPEVVAQAYVKKALEWPVVKPDSAKALDDYAIFLRECQFAVANVEAARVLEYSENLKSLIKKLPYYLHEKWRNIVYDTKERRQVVKFSQFVAFVRREAKKVNDPVYGKEVMKVSNVANKPSPDKQVGQSTKFTGSRKTFATSATESHKNDHGSSLHHEGGTVKSAIAFSKPCLYCQGLSHSMDVCKGMSTQPLRERYALLKAKGLCFGCLKSGHQKGACRQKLFCDHCKKCHPTVLHLDPRKDAENKPVRMESNNDLISAASSATHTGAGDTVHQALPIVPVRLKAKHSDKYVETYAFLDSGSTSTFCSEDVARTLNVVGKRTQVKIVTMGQEQVQNSYVISGLEICDLSGDNVLELPPVFTQPTLPVSKKDVITTEDLQRWSQLRDIPLDKIESNVGLLIGVNVPKAMEPWDVVASVGNNPFAVKTLLGWVINGPLDVTSSTDTSNRFACVNRIDIKSVPSLEEQVRNQFNHDFNERTIDDVREPSKEDNKFLDVVTQSAKFENGHYMIDLPFKSDVVSMPNNRVQADQRLSSLAKRFVRDEKFCDEYNIFMNKVITEGFARKVPHDELQQNDGQVWYLPHHGVYHPRKKKLRVVFDCAARYRGTSLNDRLLQGPNLTNTLIGTLIRFRQEKIAVMGDIDSMFYQVHVPPRHEDFLRFLWWEDGDTSNQVSEYRMVVHLFGATSSPSCANFALRKTAQDNAEDFSSVTIDTVLRNFYVDDCLKSVETESDAISLVRDLQEVLNRGGFHIAKWISNSREVMNSIPVAERAKEVKDLDLDQDVLPIERALGVQWCVESDVFRFKVVIQERPLTRRGILSMVSSVYDPLGLLAPFILKAKGILQELCRLQLGWDSKIPEELVARWCTWLEDLQKLSDFKVDRCMKPLNFGTLTNAQLHHFADASEIGYGTVSYLRLENSEGKIHCSFVMGKSRVTPLKQVTIPRLELTAATVAVRTDKMLKGELDTPIDRTVFWTDSMTVLRYIRNTTSRFHTFVANRLTVIHEGSSPVEWKYVNTKLNPADLASRGLAPEGFLQNKQWITAPEFLWEKEDRWPETPTEISGGVSSDDPEVKQVVMTTLVSSPQDPETDATGVNKLISQYSSWFALKRSVAWILKVRKELLRRVRCKGVKTDQSVQSSGEHDQPRIKLDAHEHGRLSVRDIVDAENAILSFVQQQAFASEMDTLRLGHSHVKRSSYIRKLDPILDGGLLRVGGRLDKSSMPAESKHPVILPKNNHVSTLILRQVHCELQHSGRNHMLARLRQRFWLVHAASAIRKMISKCVVCRRQRSPVGEQKMASLPEDRVTPDETPFTRVGVDYFGPFEVKQRRCRVKRYGVMFTCLASRAVHLEVATSLDTDSYINALRRFIARRGQVNKIRSDNGTNFVGAERELARAISEWNLSQIHDSMMQKNIDWQFNPPAGSHHGGVWERMIRTVRKVMNSVIGEQTLDDEGLTTLMCEIESTINDRPITRNSDHHSDLEALTPNHLLLMNRKPNLPPGVFHRTDNYCKRRWRQVQYMADLFWQRWVREYLPLLQERQKWHEQKRNLKVGDIVLIVDSNAPRNSWPMGIVLETIPDKVGFVRQVKVKTSTNTLTRPIDKLCLILEMD